MGHGGTESPLIFNIHCSSQPAGPRMAPKTRALSFLIINITFMIKKLQEEVSAHYSVEAANFYQIYNSFYLITPESVIVFRRSEMNIIDAADMPGTYQTMIDQCITIGTELTIDKWIKNKNAHDAVAEYIVKLKFMLSITTAHEIFTL